MQRRTTIAPSILAADFARLGESIAAVANDVEMLHIDVMDGHFVPNISLGPPVIRSLRAVTDLYLDCHLMISDPLRYLEPIKDAGADGVTAHIETIPNPRPVLDEASMIGLDAGLVVNPATPVDAVIPWLDRCSMVLVMSVQPGFGGQRFIESVLPKIERLRETIDSRGLDTDIQVDGGIDLRTVERARSAGANVFVAGTAVFGTEDPGATVRQMKTIVTAGEQ